MSDHANGRRIFKFIPAKPRNRYHRKSRAGCLRCKSRKVKCDETLPQCENCRRRGEHCTYVPGNLDINNPLTDHGMNARDGKLWSHFSTYFADPQGVYYKGEVAGPWLDNIPAMSLQCPALRQAILGLACSHLTNSMPECDRPRAFMYRQNAIRQLACMLEDTPAGCQSRRDEIIATCIVLRFQCSFLDDGLLEWLVLYRLTYSLTQGYRQTLAQPAETTMSEEVVKGSARSMALSLAGFNPGIFRSAITSLDELHEDVVGRATLEMFHGGLRHCFSSFLSDMASGFVGFREIFFHILLMPEVASRELLNVQTSGAPALLAHYISLILIVNALSSAFASDAESAAIGKAHLWIVALCRRAGSSKIELTNARWPVAMAQAVQICEGQLDRPSGFLSSAELYRMMTEQPKLFMIPERAVDGVSPKWRRYDPRSSESPDGLEMHVEDEHGLEHHMAELPGREGSEQQKKPLSGSQEDLE